MLKKITLITLLIGIIGFGQTELKFNLATAPLLVPNIGIEVKLSEKLGYQLDTSASFYNDIEGSPFHMTQIFNEFRFYPNKNQKRNFFIGAHVGYGKYNIRLPRLIANLSGSEYKEEGSSGMEGEHSGMTGEHLGMEYSKEYYEKKYGKYEHKKDYLKEEGSAMKQEDVK